MSKPCAYNLTRTATVYRHEVFSAGLKAAGYDVRSGMPSSVNAGDTLLIWNRYDQMHDLACRFEKAGGVVIVAENGYLSPGGGSPHHQKDRTIYALAVGYHNDSTVIPTGSPERWAALGVDLKPWRMDGGHILICGNRHFGTPGRIQPLEWVNDTRRRLQKITRREVRVRPHPGNDAPKKPLAEDLAGAWATVIWHSSAGVHSLIHGVPVICCATNWICKLAARLHGMAELDEHESTQDVRREIALHKLANAQFNLEEIQSGCAFDHLLRSGVQAQERASIAGVC